MTDIRRDGDGTILSSRLINMYNVDLEDVSQQIHALKEIISLQTGSQSIKERANWLSLPLPGTTIRGSFINGVSANWSYRAAPQLYVFP
jgi:hypothetical protein